MKKYIFILSLLLSSFLSYGQCPTTNIVLTSQEEIDNFAINYPNCTSLTYDLKIDEQNDSITNLNGLSLITSAEYIFILSTHIQNFSGLDNLVEISHLALWYNVKIQNLDGLSSLQFIDSLEMFLNFNLRDLSGLDAIQTINNVNLLSNPNLEDITDLSFIEVMYSLTLGGNVLNSLSGLENLIKITGDLNINHEQLNNLDELANLQEIGGSLYITYNPELQDIQALSNIETLENLYIVECTSLPSLLGLNNVHTVSEKLRIGFNHSLEEMYGLINIESVKELEIYENDKLISLKGLENLSKITKRLLINDNPNLRSLEHLFNVSPNEIDEVIMINNENLSICNYPPFICTVINDDLIFKAINNNAPGCNSVEEIELSCLEDFNSDTINNLEISQLLFYPNPVSESLTINVPENSTFNKAIVFSLIGEKLFETSNEIINFSSLQEGIYFVVIETDKKSSTIKIFKE